MCFPMAGPWPHVAQPLWQGRMIQRRAIVEPQRTARSACPSEVSSRARQKRVGQLCVEPIRGQIDATRGHFLAKIVARISEIPAYP